MTWAVALAIVLVACGRWDFDAEGDGGIGGGGGGGDGAARPNVAFVTSGMTDGVFAAPALTTADGICNTAAQNAGLPGKFVAWLSDSTTNAIDRLAGSRGWVRVDGQPLADTPSSFIGAEMFNPLVLDESGIAVPGNDPVWTGTGSDGHLLSDGSEWTTGAATAGSPGIDLPGFTQALTENCGTSQAHLYCFETGNVAAVAPTMTTGGRIAFVGRPRTALDNSQVLLDELCTADATAGGLTGTFLAAVATDTDSVSSRFTLDARPWVRVDGTVIAASGARLFDGTTLDSFINQPADGSYDPSIGGFFVGAMTPYVAGSDSDDCTNWNFTASGALAIVGNSHTTVAGFWDWENDTCAASDRVLCLQQ
ncbi:MAG TPA: hypothetical protein VMJ10_36870 [Kofleriaceae bacterium]|nr:hypothetical protein [Kofleriaceae bacterium]